MAQQEKVGLEARIDGLDQYLRAAKAIDDANQKITKSLKGVEQQGNSSLTNFTAGMKTAAVTGAAALGAIGVAAGKMALDFDSSMRFVNTIAKLPESGLEELSASVIETSNDIGVAATNIADGLYQALSAGVPAGEALDFIGVASKAAVAGLTETEVAVDGITTVLNSFQMATSEAGRVADIMFKTVELGKTTFPELSRFIYDVAPAAASAKVSFEETSAALALLTAQGVPTRVATTQIRQAMVGLQRPSKEMDAIFQALGYSSAQAAIEQKGLTFAMGAVRDAADGDNGKLQTLVGTIEGVQAILGTTGPNAQKMAGFLDQISNSAGATDAAFQEIERSGSRKLEKALVQIQNLLIKLGTEMIPTIAAGAEAFSNILEVVDSLASHFEDLPPVIQNISRGMGLLVVGAGAATVALKILGTTTGITIGVPGGKGLLGLASAFLIGYQAGQQFAKWLGAGADSYDSLQEAVEGLRVEMATHPKSLAEMQEQYRENNIELKALTETTGGYEEASESQQQRMIQLQAAHIVLEEEIGKLGATTEDTSKQFGAYGDRLARTQENIAEAADEQQKLDALFRARAAEQAAKDAEFMQQKAGLLAESLGRLRDSADKAHDAIMNMLMEPSAEANKRSLEIALLEQKVAHDEVTISILQEKDAAGELTDAQKDLLDAAIADRDATQLRIDTLSNMNREEEAAKRVTAAYMETVDDTVESIMNATGETQSMSRAFRGEVPEAAGRASKAIADTGDKSDITAGKYGGLKALLSSGYSIQLNASQLEYVQRLIDNIRNKLLGLLGFGNSGSSGSDASGQTAGGATPGMLAGGADNIETVLAQAVDLVERFREEAKKLGGADKLEGANALADVISGIASAIGAAVESLDALKAWEAFTVTKRKIEAFFANVQALVPGFRNIANDYETKVWEKVSLFADTLSSISGAIGDAVQGFDDLRAWEAFRLTKAKVQAFVDNALEISRAFRSMGKGWEREVLESTAGFAQVLGEVAGSIGDAVEGFTALRAWESFTLTAAKIEVFGANALAIVKALAKVAGEFKAEGAVKAAEFADALGAIAGNIGDAVAGFTALREWKAFETSEERLELFAANALALGRTLAELSRHFKAEVIVRAAEFADALGKIGGSIGNAIAGFVALREWKAFETSEERIEVFVSNALALGRALSELSKKFKTEVIQRGAEFAQALGTIGSQVGNAIAGFVALREWKAFETSEKRIAVFVANALAVGRAFAHLGKKFKSEFLVRATEFAQAIGTIGGSIGNAIAGFIALREWDAFTFTERKIAAFVENALTVGRAFAGLSRRFKTEALNHAVLFANTLGAIAGAVGAAVAGFDALREWKAFTLTDRKIAAFAENALNISRVFAGLSKKFKSAGLAGAVEFANTLGAITGVIAGSVDAFDKLREWETFALTGRKLDRFMDNVLRLARAFVEAGKKFKDAGLEGGKRFAEAVGAVVGVVGGAIDAFDRLERSQVRRLGQAKIDRLVDNLRLMVRAFAEAARKFKPEALAAAKEIGETIGPIVGAVKSAVDAMIAVAVAGDIAPEKFRRFTDLLVELTRETVRKLNTLAKGPVQEAAEIANGISSIFTGIASSYEVLTRSGLLSLEGLAAGFNFSQVRRFLAEMIDFSRAAVNTLNSLDLAKVGDAASIAEMLRSIFDAIRAGLQLAIPLSGGQEGFPSFANGGISAGGLAMVGERGPELAMLPAGTGIMPASETRGLIGALHGLSMSIPRVAAGGGGRTINTSYNVNATYSRPESPQGIELTLRTLAMRSHF